VFSCSSSCGNIISFNSDYYVFNGVYRKSTAANPMIDWVSESGYGFKVDNSNGNATNAGFQGGTGYNGGTCGSLSACSAAGMFVHDVTVEYVDVNGKHESTDGACCDMGFDFEGGSYNLDFSHNFTHDDWVPYYIKGNHNGQAGSGYWFGSGANNTIEYTYVQHNYSSPTYHSEACSCDEGMANFTWRYNVSDQIGGVGSNGSTAHIGTASGCSTAACNGPNGPWYIYGNVFACTATVATNNCAVGDGVFAAWATSFTGNIYFLNNTVYGVGPPSLNGGFGMGLGYTGSNVSTFTNLYAENNLWFSNDPMTVIPTGTTSCGDGSCTYTSVSWSYNSYFKTPSAAGSDSDANKQTSSSNPFISSVCCSLSSDTAAGVSTSGLVAGNSLDMMGVTRGVNGTWDRGALQIQIFTGGVVRSGSVVVAGSSVQR